MTPRIRFDFSAIDPRYRALIIGGVIIIAAALISLIVLLPRENEPETAQSASRTASPSPSPSPLVSASPPGPPTNTATAAQTATLVPYEYVVQAEDTLGFIIQQFGYRDLSIIPEIIALNNLACEACIQEGQTLLIPRQTPTPGPSHTASPTLNPLITPGTATPTGTVGSTLDMTPQTYVGCSPENRCVSPDGQYWIHNVVEGDTVSSIARAYSSFVPCLLEANGMPPDPILSIGQEIRVCILVTLTPTLTPTGGPDSTATPTPQPSAPSLLAPAMNADIGREDVVFQWATVHPLAEGQWYLLIVMNRDTGEEVKATTRSNSYRIPASQLEPGNYEWRVAVVGSSSADAPILSLPGETRLFSWGG
jgi:LysM repeat protein